MTCETCGLPEELCVCDDVERSQSSVTVTTEERAFDKPVTLVEGVDSNRDELASELKSRFACGGTNKEGRIELQGDHVQGVADELEDRGFDVTVDE
jgi:translation initiation factor 1